MLLADLASVVIASCYDGDTFITTTGARVRLACIDSPELSWRNADPVPAKAVRDHLRGLVGGKEVESDGPLKTAMDEQWLSCPSRQPTCSKSWSPLVTVRSISG